MLRQQFSDALKDAMRARDQRAVSTVRMILAGLKDKDIAARPKGNAEGIPDPEILDLLQAMVRQRRESIGMFEQGNRPDLVQQGHEEIAVIERFMPAQLDEAGTEQAVRDAITAAGASTVKDMGRVVAELRARHAGRMDFAKASALARSLLTAAQGGA